MVHIIPLTVPICESLEVFSGVHSYTTDQHKDLRPTSTARDGIHLKITLPSTPHSSTRVNIWTGIVAPATANADRAIELGELTANQLTCNNWQEHAEE